MDEWKELLQKHQTQENDPSQTTDGASRDSGSLLQQVRELVGQTDGAGAGEADGGAENPIRFSDGYVRRTPVQEYFTPADYRRKTIRKWLLIVCGVCLAALLVIALYRTGLLSFK